MANVLNYNFNKDKHPDPIAIKNQVKSKTITCHIYRNGKLEKPVMNFKLEKLSVGTYKLNHNLGYKYYNVSYHLDNQQINITTETMDEYSITSVVKDLDGNLVDKDFDLTISITDQSLGKG